VTEEGGGALVALLLETLRAHGAKESVGGQRNMSSTRRCRWATLVSDTAGDAHAASSRGAGLRPSVLAARVCSRNGRRPGRRQAGLSCWARHAQHAAASGAALLFGRSHGHGVVVVAGAITISTRSMTSNRCNLELEGRRDRISARRRDGYGERRWAKTAGGRGRSDWK
jgi:hypothetical protein